MAIVSGSAADALMGFPIGAYGPGDPRIIGSSPFTCDLCMATGWAAEPCPFHAEKSWAEWLTDALREWGYTIQRMLRHTPIPLSADHQV